MLCLAVCGLTAQWDTCSASLIHAFCVFGWTRNNPSKIELSLPAKTWLVVGQWQNGALLEQSLLSIKYSPQKKTPHKNRHEHKSMWSIWWFLWCLIWLLYAFTASDVDNNDDSGGLCTSPAHCAVMAAVLHWSSAKVFAGPMKMAFKFTFWGWRQEIQMHSWVDEHRHYIWTVNHGPWCL